MSEIIFDSFFKLFDVRLGSCVDADNENVAFAVYLENLGFGNLELCDATAGKDKIPRRGFRERKCDSLDVSLALTLRDETLRENQRTFPIP